MEGEGTVCGGRPMRVMRLYAEYESDRRALGSLGRVCDVGVRVDMQIQENRLEVSYQILGVCSWRHGLHMYAVQERLGHLSSIHLALECTHACSGVLGPGSQGRPCRNRKRGAGGDMSSGHLAGHKAARISS